MGALSKASQKSRARNNSYSAPVGLQYTPEAGIRGTMEASTLFVSKPAWLAREFIL